MPRQKFVVNFKSYWTFKLTFDSNIELLENQKNLELI